MGFVEFVKRLEKRGIVTRKPHPAFVFILSLVAFVLGSVFNRVGFRLFGNIFYFIFVFSFLFAIVHLIVWWVLKKG